MDINLLTVSLLVGNVLFLIIFIGIVRRTREESRRLYVELLEIQDSSMASSVSSMVGLAKKMSEMDKRQDILYELIRENWEFSKSFFEHIKEIKDEMDASLDPKETNEVSLDRDIEKMLSKIEERWNNGPKE